MEKLKKSINNLLLTFLPQPKYVKIVTLSRKHYYSLDYSERFNRALEFSCKLGTKDFSAIYFSSSLINSLLDDPPPVFDPDLELTILQ